MLTSFKKRLKGFIRSLIHDEVQTQMQEMLPLIPQLLEFQNSPKEERQSHYDHTKAPLESMDYYAGLKERLVETGIPVEEADIDPLDFEAWLAEFPEIKSHYQGMGDAFIEKCLEHYLVYKYLRISPDDVYIDIAASGSPFADILNKRGIKSYRLDLAYPAGIHGTNIGADAGATGLPAGFATVLSAQCAYECFMGDADIRFIRESDRILRSNGRYAIIPLYLEDTYFIATSPYCDQKDVLIDDGARRVWRDDGYRVPFSRFYSPKSFTERIHSIIPEGMHVKIIYFPNIPDIMKRYPNQKIYCYFMLYCEKMAL
jgi:hypothetical protein